MQLRGSGFAPEIRQNIIFLPKTVLKKRACAAVRRFALIEIGWKVSQVQRRLGTEKKSTGPACWKSNIILSQQPDIMKTLKIKSRPSSATSLFGHYLAEGVSLLSICAKKDPLRARYQKKKTCFNSITFCTKIFEGFKGYYEKQWVFEVVQILLPAAHGKKPR